MGMLFLHPGVVPEQLKDHLAQVLYTARERLTAKLSYPSGQMTFPEVPEDQRASYELQVKAVLAALTPILGLYTTYQGTNGRWYVGHIVDGSSVDRQTFATKEEGVSEALRKNIILLGRTHLLD